MKISQFCVTSGLVVAQAYNFKRDRLWVRFSPEEMKYLIFSYLRSIVEAKRGVEIRHSTQCLQNSAESVLTLGSLYHAYMLHVIQRE